MSWEITYYSFCLFECNILLQWQMLSSLGVQEHEQLRFGQIETQIAIPIMNKTTMVELMMTQMEKFSKQLSSLTCCAIRPLFFQSSSAHYQASSPFLFETASICTNWHQAMVLGGKMKLQTMVKDMFKDVRIEGRFINQSLRASGTTALFDAGIPEAVIQKCTGHKSINALHRTSM